MLGMGTEIGSPAGLPTMGADGQIPKDLGKKYGKMILEADGFAQVFECACMLVPGLAQTFAWVHEQLPHRVLMMHQT